MWLLECLLTTREEDLAVYAHTGGHARLVNTGDKEREG